MSATTSGEYAKKRCSVLIFVQSIFLYQLEIIWNAVAQIATSTGQTICDDDNVISYPTRMLQFVKKETYLMTWPQLLNVYGTALCCQEWLPGVWHARPRRMTCSDSVIMEQCVKDHRRKSSVKYRQTSEGFTFSLQLLGFFLDQKRNVYLSCGGSRQANDSAVQWQKVSAKFLLRYGSEWHYRQNRIKSIFRLVKW